MSDLVVFDTLHGKPVNDCELDYYSRKLATCSSDNTVKIFDVSFSREPVCIAEFRDHSSAVWKVSWSHPKYGSLLATCSYDKSIIIYKEVSINKYDIIYINNEHKSSVNYVEWSPHEYGLHLGCASSDGCISIISYNLHKGINDIYWNKYTVKGHLNGVSSISWEKQYNSILHNKHINDNTNSNNNNNNNDNNDNNVTSFKIVSGGYDNQVIIWIFDNITKEFHKHYQMCDKPHNASIKDVAWRPNINSGLNLIASCSDDKIILWVEDVSNNKWKNAQIIKLENTIHKISWSPNGTILAVACANDNAYLFKESIDGQWENICNLADNEKKIEEEFIEEKNITLNSSIISPECNGTATSTGGEIHNFVGINENYPNALQQKDVPPMQSALVQGNIPPGTFQNTPYGQTPLLPANRTLNNNGVSNMQSKNIPPGQQNSSQSYAVMQNKKNNTSGGIPTVGSFPMGGGGGISAAMPPPPPLPHEQQYSSYGNANLSHQLGGANHIAPTSSSHFTSQPSPSGMPLNMANTNQMNNKSKFAPSPHLTAYNTQLPVQPSIQPPAPFPKSPTSSVPHPSFSNVNSTSANAHPSGNTQGMSTTFSKGPNQMQQENFPNINKTSFNSQQLSPPPPPPPPPPFSPSSTQPGTNMTSTLSNPHMQTQKNMNPTNYSPMNYTHPLPPPLNMMNNDPNAKQPGLQYNSYPNYNAPSQ
ncbi:protein transport protein SEC13, putative [Plasmodium ovale]|uniref:Protein transport protein SEC13, putative n=2 Tax=Plasmodium ovale TaxID=36330 RepID=A0A1D3UAJ7_PLAOA|nr:protein transport protein SEC13, putative (SEC13) [Plasmodium ovale curtisi]SBS98442.1 protein transport protein SEC13, putative (SEC13) [Plasmodium ovale curtisi]SCQ17119.1 protein transport protein SEC13, putative [Plasmodium ovale]